jgi:hypothetical protein
LIKENYRKIKLIVYADEYNGILDWIRYGLKRLKEVYFCYEDMKVPRYRSGLDKIAIGMLYPSSSIPKILEVFKKYLGSKHSYGLDFEIERKRIEDIREIEEMDKILKNQKILNKSEAKKEWGTITKKNIDSIENEIKYFDKILKGYERMIVLLEEESKKEPEKIEALENYKRKTLRLSKKIHRFEKELERVRKRYEMG